MASYRTEITKHTSAILSTYALIMLKSTAFSCMLAVRMVTISPLP
jgi:hypothetical protein